MFPAGHTTQGFPVALQEGRDAIEDGKKEGMSEAGGNLEHPL